MTDFSNKKSKQKGFIRVGAIFFVLAILIALRMYWGIDIAEPAKEAFQKSNIFTGKLIAEAKELFNVIGTLF